MNLEFGDVWYKIVAGILLNNSTSITVRNKEISHEICGISLRFAPSNYVQICSSKFSRAFPIQFALAEFLWILNGSNEVKKISKWNKSMEHFSDDGVKLSGAYGKRLHDQFNFAIQKLVNDKYSRQSILMIANPTDVTIDTKDFPCNTQIQLLTRNDMLDMIVTSRSSDFITGLPIDYFHFKLLQILICNQLKNIYNNIECGHLLYNIGSLHVYESDRELLNAITNDERMFSYNLTINEKFEVLKAISELKFDSITSLEEMLNIYKFDFLSENNIVCLQEIFSSRLYKVLR